MKKEQLKKGAIIECNGIVARVLDPNWKNNTIKISVNGTVLLLSQSWLNDWIMVNPIKNNRIISDKTFAIRFRDFIKDVEVNDPCSNDEKEYLLNVAERLLNYQLDTVTDENEIDYLKRLNLL